MIITKSCGSVVGSVALVVVLSSAVLPGCGNAQDTNGHTPPAPPGKTEELPEQAQDGFQRGKKIDPALVIVLDPQGNFRTFRGRNTKGTIPLKDVLPAEIDEVISITVIKTTNTKWCFTTSLGEKECVEL